MESAKEKPKFVQKPLLSVSYKHARSSEGTQPAQSLPVSSRGEAPGVCVRVRVSDAKAEAALSVASSPEASLLL